jgi:alpha-beta hydrolase superfamily lysophospholipase
VGCTSPARGDLHSAISQNTRSAGSGTEISWKKSVSHSARPFEPFRLLTPDGIQLAGLLGRPEYTESRPRGVLLVHGFCGDKTENGLFSHIADSLVGRGFHVLAYDWRGLGESTGEFQDYTLGVHAWDFELVSAWFTQQYRIQPENTCALGFSLGATVIVRSLEFGCHFGSAAFLSPAVKPAISMLPRYNTPEQKEEIRLTGLLRKPENQVCIGTKMLESLQRASFEYQDIQCGKNVLVCHGSEDARIPVNLVREEVGKLYSPNVSYHELSGASHSFQPRPHYNAQLTDLLQDWLERQNNESVGYTFVTSSSIRRSSSSNEKSLPASSKSSSSSTFRARGSNHAVATRAASS